MRDHKVFFLAASAVVLFSAGAFAADGALLALNPAPAAGPGIKVSALLQPATAQAPVEEPGVTAFDALSAAGDPLFREGSKALLKEAARQDGLKAKENAGTAPAFRDAPSDAAPAAVPAKPVISRPKAKKPVHADPLQVKDTL